MDSQIVNPRPRVKFREEKNIGGKEKIGLVLEEVLSLWKEIALEIIGLERFLEWNRQGGRQQQAKGRGRRLFCSFYTFSVGLIGRMVDTGLGAYEVTGYFS